MPRSFDMVAEYLGNVAQVHRAFCDKDYWLTRLAKSGPQVVWSLDSITDDGQGATDIVTTQTVSAKWLPAVATQFHRGDMSLIREEHWGPVIDDRALGTVRSHIPGAPANITGKAVLTPGERGARLNFSATVEVRIPLVGGKLEALLGHQIEHLLQLEQEFTSEWIAAEY